MRQMPNVAASEDAGSSKIGSTEANIHKRPSPVSQLFPIMSTDGCLVIVPL